MPTYNYRNTVTGEEWSEFRSMSEMEDGVDGVEVVLMPSTPVLGDPSVFGPTARRRGSEFSQVLARIKRQTHAKARHL